MARMPFLSRRRDDEPPEPPAAEAAPAPQRRPLPSASRLRRERRTLLRVREERIRDLGGLVLEMYRRQGFRQDLVDEQCAELVSLEDRLHELDSLLAVSVNARRAQPSNGLANKIREPSERARTRSIPLKPSAPLPRNRRIKTVSA